MHSHFCHHHGRPGRRCQLIPHGLRDYWRYLREDDRLAEFLRLAGPLLVAAIDLLRLIQAISSGAAPRH